MLDKGSAAITKCCAALRETLKVFDAGAAEYLPPPTNKEVDIATKLAEVVIADWTMAAAPEWEGSFAELMDKLNEANTQLQDTTRAVKVYAEAAKAATAQSDP